jgi:hypothetical protein
MDKLNWRDLNETLPHLSEQQVLEMLEAEKAGPRRLTTLVRLHQRHTALRASRERAELLQLGAANDKRPE